jgi:hypothetical protein
MAQLMVTLAHPLAPLGHHLRLHLEIWASFTGGRSNLARPIASIKSRFGHAVVLYAKSMAQGLIMFVLISRMLLWSLLQVTSSSMTMVPSWISFYLLGLKGNMLVSPRLHLVGCFVSLKYR